MSEWYVICLDLSEGQVRTSQVRTGQVRTGQVRTGQDKYLKVSRTIQVENIIKLINKVKEHRSRGDRGETENFAKMGSDEVVQRGRQWKEWDRRGWAYRREKAETQELAEGDLRKLKPRKTR